MFSNSSSFTEAKKELYQEGLMTYFKFRKCFEHHKPKIKTLLHVFDHTIKPVLLYGSAIWGILSAEKLNKLRHHYFNKLCSDLIAERLHVKFCKYVLEVSRRSTNIGIAGELGRYALFLEVILNMIKYFIHLSNPIVAEAFEASRKLHLENKRFWYRNITEVIDYFGMDKCKIFNLKSTLKNIYSSVFV